MNINKYLNDWVPEELNAELWNLMSRLNLANDQLTNYSIEWAITEDAYRAAKATAILKYKADEKHARATVQMLDALVDTDCISQRQAAYLARANKEAALELVRSLRAQLSALQSIAAGMRSEMELAGMPQPRW